jgi:hypothetical protein
MSSMAEELSGQAEQLQTSISFFKLKEQAGFERRPAARAKNTVKRVAVKAKEVGVKESNAGAGISLSLHDGDQADTDFVRY